MINQISKIYSKILRAIRNNLSCLICVIFVMIILYASWLLYNFVYKPISTLPEATFEKTSINRAMFDKITEQINLREKIFSEASEKEYKDIFK